MPARLSKCAYGVLAALLITNTSLSFAKTESMIPQQLHKLDSNGLRVDASDTTWSCVEDANTGLYWQKRDPSKALHNHATYTWFQPLQNIQGSELSYATGSPLNVTCDGFQHDVPATYCNTDAYVKRVNLSEYCGFNDWRLPTSTELISLASPMASISAYIPAINLDYFPFYDRFVYWTRSLNHEGNILTVARETRVLDNAEPSDQLLVRLVRGTQY